jgi:hypothetical protein
MDAAFGYKDTGTQSTCAGLPKQSQSILGIGLLILPVSTSGMADPSDVKVAETTQCRADRAMNASFSIQQ